MSTPYIGELRVMGFQFAPRGWALCNGQLLSIQQNQALFSILGTTYGGNGINNFQLPNLQSRVPMHWGTAPGGGNFVLGQTGGEEAHTLTTNEIPAHTHPVTVARVLATSPLPTNNLLAQTSKTSEYAAPDNSANVNAGGLSGGGGQPHSNLQPYLTVSVCIALVGIFPSRN